MIARKRFLAVITFVILMIGPSACWWSPSPCANIPGYFEIQHIELHNMVFASNQQGWREADVTEAIQFTDLFLHAELEHTFIAATHPPGGFNLYATDCSPRGYNGTNVGLDTLYVIALDDYNNNFSEKDTLNDIITVKYMDTDNYDHWDEFVPLSEYVSHSQESIYRPDFYFKIGEAPSSEGTFGFLLVYIMADGKKFEATTNITMTP